MSIISRKSNVPGIKLISCKNSTKIEKNDIKKIFLIEYALYTSDAIYICNEVAAYTYKASGKLKIIQSGNCIEVDSLINIPDKTSEP